MAHIKKSPLPAEEGSVREEFPKDWSDIRGHAEIIRRLRFLAAAERLPHALLFTGAEGVGKRRTAHVLARTLLCAKGGDAPCGHCDSCRTMEAGVHPDYFEAVPEARGKGAAAIRTDAVREILVAASGAPISARRRIILIDDADRMNETAANRLLKTLEEPSGEVIFILVTSACEAILPTIRSRAVRIAFGALPRTELETALAERGTDNGETIAALADGSLGRAYALAAEGLSLRDDALRVLAELPALSMEDIWRYAEKIGAYTHEERRAWLGYFQTAMRDLLLLLEDGTASQLFHPDRSSDLGALLAHMLRPQIFALLDESRKLLRRFDANVNPALQAEAFLIRARQQFI